MSSQPPNSPGGLEFDPGPGGIFLNIPQELAAHEYLRPHSMHTKKEKSWTERVAYETGVCYLSGLIAGGSIGAVQGWRLAQPNIHFKLKLNSLLNHSGRLGSTTANGLGVFALLFSLSRSFYKSQRNKSDFINDVAGIVTAGTLSTLPKGPIAAVGMGLALGSTASIMVWLRKQTNKDTN